MNDRMHTYILAALLQTVAFCAVAWAQTPHSGMTMAMPEPAAAPATQPTSTAQTTQTITPTVTLESTTEEGQKVLHAAVTVEGKPVQNATVAFYVRRTFGNMLLGQDQTEEDGTAAIPFPTDLPGIQGQLQVTAVVTAPPEYTSGNVAATFPGAPAVPASADTFPRALWAPQAPWMLILTILAILAAVWLAYLYVGIQLLRIRQRRG